ncbi:MAG: hypothetical protein ACRES7_08325 [Gammaproteobacteria bacterium]
MIDEAKEAADLPEHGAFEVGLTIPNVRNDLIADTEFLRLIASAEVNRRGWPFWFTGARNAAPCVTQGSYQAHIVRIGRNVAFPGIEFWTASPRGEFYARRAFGEDIGLIAPGAEPLSIFAYEWHIADLAESILAGLTLYRVLCGSGDKPPLSFSFRWSKMSGRRLYGNNPFVSVIMQDPCQDDVIAEHAEVQFETASPGILQHTYQVMRCVLSNFGGWAVPYEHILGIVHTSLRI